MFSYFFFFISTHKASPTDLESCHIWIVFFQGESGIQCWRGAKDFSRKYLGFSWQEEPTFEAQLS